MTFKFFLVILVESGMESQEHEYMLHDPTIHQKCDAQDRQERGEDQDQRLMQAWLLYAEQRQRQKRREQFQHEALIGEQDIGLIQGRIEQDVDNIEAHPQVVAHTLSAPAHNHQRDKTERRCQIEQQVRLVGGAERLWFDQQCRNRLPDPLPGPRQVTARMLLHMDERQWIADRYPAVDAVERRSQGNQSDRQHANHEAAYVREHLLPRHPQFIEIRDNEQNTHRAYERRQQAQPASQPPPLHMQ